jgi:transporter family-2 protein
MNAAWIYPFIILGGALQTCGAAMNARLFQSLGNKWLANAVSFALILALFVCVFAMFPNPLATVWPRCHVGRLWAALWARFRFTPD